MGSLQGVPQNAASFLRRFLIGKGTEIARKTAEQFLLNVGLKLALQIGPVDIVAANDKGFILFPICSILQEFSGSNIMAAKLVVPVPLQVTSVVTQGSIAGGTTRYAS